MTITFIQTGGTIDKDYPHTSKGWAFEIHEPALERVLEKLNPSFEFNVVSAFKKDSLEITNDDLKKLREIIEQVNSDKIIITHGTDTMAKTASFISDLSIKKTIVITGSMRPQKFVDTDADVNLGMAIAAVQTSEFGVFLCMHGIVIPEKQVDRDMTTGKYFKKAEK